MKKEEKGILCLRACSVLYVMPESQAQVGLFSWSLSYTDL